jgi:hypothetical protein
MSSEIGAFMLGIAILFASLIISFGLNGIAAAIRERKESRP